MRTNDTATTGRLIDSSFLPYLDIRNKQAGYAASIVKAGAILAGHSAGPVRTPLTDLNAQFTKALPLPLLPCGNDIRAQWRRDGNDGHAARQDLQDAQDDRELWFARLKTERNGRTLRGAIRRPGA